VSPVQLRPSAQSNVLANLWVRPRWRRDSNPRGPSPSFQPRVRPRNKIASWHPPDGSILPDSISDCCASSGPICRWHRTRRPSHNALCPARRLDVATVGVSSLYEGIGLATYLDSVGDPTRWSARCRLAASRRRATVSPDHRAVGSGAPSVRCRPALARRA